jgi:MoaA/NifB/PqqE/SkfB family radical SAM enzyme
MRLSAGKRLKKRSQLRFDVQLADHCNLNCMGCSNYSPIAPKNFLKKESFNKDCERLSLLSGGNLEDIYLFGGEPLLHPEIIEIIRIARKHFQNTDIVILTNGILLPKMNDTFWECCREHNIKITITKYPVKIDITSIKEIAKKFSVKLEIFYENTERKFFFRPLNLKNLTDAKKNFLFCPEANRCIILRNGRLSCTTASNIEILNNAIMSSKGGGGGI